MPVQSDSIIYCIKLHETPEGTKFNQKTIDKVGNETTSKQTRTSTNQEEKKEENKNAFPTNTNDYCTSHSNCISQAINRQVNKLHRQVG